jgi:integrase
VAHVRLYLTPYLGELSVAQVQARSCRGRAGHGQFGGRRTGSGSGGGPGNGPRSRWTAQQTAQFLASIEGHRLYAAYHLIALRGLRRGEAAGRRWCDIDLGGKTAVITQQQQYEGRLAMAGGGLNLSCPRHLGRPGHDRRDLRSQTARWRIEPLPPPVPLPVGAARQAFGRQIIGTVHACRYARLSTSSRLPGSFRP